MARTSGLLVQKLWSSASELAFFHWASSFKKTKKKMWVVGQMCRSVTEGQVVGFSFKAVQTPKILPTCCLSQQLAPVSTVQNRSLDQEDSFSWRTGKRVFNLKLMFRTDLKKQFTQNLFNHPDVYWNLCWMQKKIHTFIHSKMSFWGQYLYCYITGKKKKSKKQCMCVF